MKKLLIALMLCFTLCVPAFAEDTMPQPNFAIPGWNIQGDLLILREAGFCAGIGMDLISYKDIAFLRGEMALPLSGDANAFGDSLTGLAVVTDVPKLITQLGGTWLPATFFPRIGLVALVNPAKSYDEGAIRGDWGGIITLIEKKF